MTSVHINALNINLPLHVLDKIDLDKEKIVNINLLLHVLNKTDLDKKKIVR